MKRIFLFLIVAFPLFPQSAWETSLFNLTEGNKRYLAGKHNEQIYSEQRDEQRNGQHPYAIILTCADSRVPPEILFDEGLGQLFVVRVAGNVIDEVILGSIEYAAEHLHVPLLVVLGHSSCGAVSATIAGGDNGKNINALTAKIKPAVDESKKILKTKNFLLPLAIEKNVEFQVSYAAKNSHILNELLHENKFQILGAVYSIETGEVSFFDIPKETADSKKEKNNHNNSKDKYGKEENHFSNTKTTGEEKRFNGKYNLNTDTKIKDNIYSDGNLFVIQHSSWKNKSRAEQEVKKLKEERHDAFVVSYFNKEDGSTWYRVRIGYFSSLHEVEVYLQISDLTMR